jgi:hypothetical protein
VRGTDLTFPKRVFCHSDRLRNDDAVDQWGKKTELTYAILNFLVKISYAKNDCLQYFYNFSHFLAVLDFREILNFKKQKKN